MYRCSSPFLAWDQATDAVCNCGERLHALAIFDRAARETHERRRNAHPAGPLAVPVSLRLAHGAGEAVRHFTPAQTAPFDSGSGVGMVVWWHDGVLYAVASPVAAWLNDVHRHEGRAPFAPALTRPAILSTAPAPAPD